MTHPKACGALLQQLAQENVSTPTNISQTSKKVNQAVLSATGTTSHPKALGGLLQRLNSAPDTLLEKNLPPSSGKVSIFSAHKRTNPALSVDSSLHCKLCDIYCTSPSHLQDHLIGKKHKKKLAKLETGAETENLSNTNINGALPNEKIAHLELQLQSSTEPVLGLEYVLEYQDCDPMRYECKLCNSRGMANIMTSHLLGQKHRLKYAGKHHPDQFHRMTAGPDAMTKKYGELTRQLKEYAHRVISSRPRHRLGLVKISKKPYVFGDQGFNKMESPRPGVPPPHRGVPPKPTGVLPPHRGVPPKLTGISPLRGIFPPKPTGVLPPRGGAPPKPPGVPPLHPGILPMTPSVPTLPPGAPPLPPGAPPPPPSVPPPPPSVAPHLFNSSPFIHATQPAKDTAMMKQLTQKDEELQKAREEVEQLRKDLKDKEMLHIMLLANEKEKLLEEARRPDLSEAAASEFNLSPASLRTKAPIESAKLMVDELVADACQRQDYREVQLIERLPTSDQRLLYLLMVQQKRYKSSLQRLDELTQGSESSATEQIVKMKLETALQKLKADSREILSTALLAEPPVARPDKSRVQLYDERCHERRHEDERYPERRHNDERYHERRHDDERYHERRHDDREYSQLLREREEMMELNRYGNLSPRNGETSRNPGSRDNSQESRRRHHDHDAERSGSRERRLDGDKRLVVCDSDAYRDRSYLSRRDVSPDKKPIYYDDRSRHDPSYYYGNTSKQSDDYRRSSSHDYYDHYLRDYRDSKSHESSRDRERRSTSRDRKTLRKEDAADDVTRKAVEDKIFQSLCKGSLAPIAKAFSNNPTLQAALKIWEGKQKEEEAHAQRKRKSSTDDVRSVGSSDHGSSGIGKKRKMFPRDESCDDALVNGYTNEVRDRSPQRYRDAQSSEDERQQSHRRDPELDCSHRDERGRHGYGAETRDDFYRDRRDLPPRGASPSAVFRESYELKYESARQQRVEFRQTITYHSDSYPGSTNSVANDRRGYEIDDHAEDAGLREKGGREDYDTQQRAPATGRLAAIKQAPAASVHGYREAESYRSDVRGQYEEPALNQDDLPHQDDSPLLQLPPKKTPLLQLPGRHGDLAGRHREEENFEPAARGKVPLLKVPLSARGEHREKIMFDDDDEYVERDVADYAVPAKVPLLQAPKSRVPLLRTPGSSSASLRSPLRGPLLRPAGGLPHPRKSSPTEYPHSRGASSRLPSPGLLRSPRLRVPHSQAPRLVDALTPVAVPPVGGLLPHPSKKPLLERPPPLLEYPN